MIGQTLSHYKIIEKLGQGGMGEVYLAEDSRLDRKVALKILPEHLSERAELRERFEREARAVSSLNHPHICTLYDIGEQNGIHYLVMEHLVGETLEARLAKGALPLEQTLGTQGFLVIGMGTGIRPYDITPDGQRFLMIFPADQTESGEPARERINIVLNWFEELKERVPVP